MNVNLGLPARCHSVKQAYRMTSKSFFQFPERPCLCLTQRRNTNRFGDLRMRQTAYLVWIGLQYALLFQSTANRQTATNSFYQAFRPTSASIFGLRNRKAVPAPASSKYFNKRDCCLGALPNPSSNS